MNVSNQQITACEVIVRRVNGKKKTCIQEMSEVDRSVHRSERSDSLIWQYHDSRNIIVVLTGAEGGSLEPKLPGDFVE